MVFRARLGRPPPLMSFLGITREERAEVAAMSVEEREAYTAGKAERFRAQVVASRAAAAARQAAAAGPGVVLPAAAGGLALLWLLL